MGARLRNVSKMRVLFSLLFGASFLYEITGTTEVNLARQPRHARCQSELDAGTASRLRTLPKEAKLGYLKLNSGTPCPSRGAVPVNPQAWFRKFVSTQHAWFVFGDRCDHSRYVGSDETKISFAGRAVR
jgi:hypothetical protein